MSETKTTYGSFCVEPRTCHVVTVYTLNRLAKHRHVSSRRVLGWVQATIIEDLDDDDGQYQRNLVLPVVDQEDGPMAIDPDTQGIAGFIYPDSTVDEISDIAYCAEALREEGYR